MTSSPSVTVEEAPRPLHGHAIVRPFPDEVYVRSRQFFEVSPFCPNYGGAFKRGCEVAPGWLSFASKDEEVRAHLVEIAIGILRVDLKEDVTPVRAWAIDVIEKNSGVKFEPPRAAELHDAFAAERFSHTTECFSAPGATVSRKICQRVGV
jgi:hypothetical protein